MRMEKARAIPIPVRINFCADAAPATSIARSWWGESKVMITRAGRHLDALPETIRRSRAPEHLSQARPQSDHRNIFQSNVAQHHESVDHLLLSGTNYSKQNQRKKARTQRTLTKPAIAKPPNEKKPVNERAPPTPKTLENRASRSPGETKTRNQAM
mmetsp:Transcript_2725/g.12147  ORF Transcript_2725/g.12147 Transcript_2725/m.12147 type:complete len:156 (-) Transcript_2725:151-618(-)